MMKHLSLAIGLLFVFFAKAQTQDLSLYQKQWFIQYGDTLPYRILLPENYDATKTYPLVLFLHGRGESGNDNEKQLMHGAKLFLQDSIRKKYPAIVVFPQCSATSYWSNVQAVTSDSKTGKRSFYFVPDGEPTTQLRLVMSLLDNLQVRYRIQKKQVYVMGLSMGGMGTFELVRRKPNLFAAAVPICGGANPATAAQLVKTKWWVFHGGKDDVVLPAFSQKMVEALKQQKASVKFTFYPDANHNSWDAAFAEPQLLQWLFQQRKQ
ncbi:phospholipase [Lacibacter luteus]|uniref:Phospholipase n=1 Tax=Lacibacter luteus TaxID=2508719 RepID=A0A4Q1CEK1_9BACT|nr:prolyl oligopeptidase family serine peptidase [Lacibacter luteus]RXK58318.1 phospholipase [Lacibacter luteus]